MLRVSRMAKPGFSYRLTTWQELGYLYLHNGIWDGKADHPTVMGRQGERRKRFSDLWIPLCKLVVVAS